MIEISDIWYDKQIPIFQTMSVKLEGMPSNLATADTFTGKKVIDREGIEYGKVKHIHINQDTLTVSGVTIHQGFNKDYFLSDDYIDKFSEETLLLCRPPVRTGIPVTDIDQNKVGKVKRLHRNPDTNELESIEVSDGLMHSKILSKSEIWGIGEKVILRMTKEEFKHLE
ncbi:PRC-barrel domain-containing protein [Candidatus Nitrosopumilus sp. SW]|uniref:PRC-barrel domain-containing protein n=1 Tax=Candidatus Nitrosopumilus sp. SW TaxID=2508726 RepID=UPI002106E96D|nr:PRC-barrel domain-containing protein [Candidatus Nitrosopumilus sp. SW]